MSREKQIEEMARDICRVKQNCNDVCNPIKTCQALKYAERAYEAGYRKQSVGEWRSVSDYADSRIVECSNCDKQFYFKKKGQLNIDRMPIAPIAERR